MGTICSSLILFFSLTGCSSITIKHHIIGNKPPLCNKNSNPKKVAVYWGTAWRESQKEIQIREKYINDGLNTFFNSSDCFEMVSISKTITNKNVLLSTDEELIPGAIALGADKVIKLRFEELGPNLYLYLSPILWETQNEVSVRVKVLNTKTGKLESDISTQWKRGGAFTLNGAGSLPDDLAGTLKVIFHGK